MPELAKDHPKSCQGNRGGGGGHAQSAAVGGGVISVVVARRCGGGARRGAGEIGVGRSALISSLGGAGGVGPAVPSAIRGGIFHYEIAGVVHAAIMIIGSHLSFGIANAIAAE